MYLPQGVYKAVKMSKNGAMKLTWNTSSEIIVNGIKEGSALSTTYNEWDDLHKQWDNATHAYTYVINTTCILWKTLAVIKIYIPRLRKK